jgi:anaerobic magnesium-protoporphyrin IX monomethyl ester cyclase
MKSQTENPNILLVNPPVNRLCDVATNYFPLGLGYLAAMTNRMGFRTSIYNAELETRTLPFPYNRRRIMNHRLFIEALRNDSHFVWEEFRGIVKRLKPSIVGFSCTSASILPCLKMAEESKVVSNCITVFGGMHPTILPEETARSGGVDYIIAGDAEKSFPSFVEALTQGEDPLKVPGVGRYLDTGFQFTPPEPLEQDINRFPFPDREVLVNIESHKKHLDAVVTSRGCPYECTFCSGRNLTGGGVRYRSVESVVDEMKEVMERYQMKHIMFYDDALLIHKKRMIKICLEILNQKVKVTWGGFTRADSVDPEILGLMKESGCTYLGIGVESGSDRVLKKIKKGYTREQAIDGVQLIKKSGIDVSINMIIGFPFERAEDIQDSISLIEELHVPTNINTFTPYPKTELFEECVSRGLIQKGIDWSSISQHSPYNEFVQEIAPEDYRVLLKRMIFVADRIHMERNRGNTARLIRGWRGTVGEIWQKEKQNPLHFIRTLLLRALRLIRTTLRT